MSQHPSPNTSGNYGGIPPSLIIPPSILASAEKLARKAAELNGLIAPQTASCLAKLIDAAAAPLTQAWVSTEHWGVGSRDSSADPAIDPRRRIVALMGRHDQLVISQPSGSGAAWTLMRFAPQS